MLDVDKLEIVSEVELPVDVEPELVEEVVCVEAKLELTELEINKLVLAELVVPVDAEIVDSAVAELELTELEITELELTELVLPIDAKFVVPNDAE